MIFMGMLFDGLDGRIARLTRNTSDLGEQLDSMADMVTFGVAPAFLAVQVTGVHTPFVSATNDLMFDRFVVVVASIYVACAALRLARFNIEVGSDDHSDHNSFKGLPSPGAAGTVAGMVLLQQHFLVHRPDLHKTLVAVEVGLVAIVLLSALAMVSRLRYMHVINRYVARAGAVRDARQGGGGRVAAADPPSGGDRGGFRGVLAVRARGVGGAAACETAAPRRLAGAPELSGAARRRVVRRHACLNRLVGFDDGGQPGDGVARVGAVGRDDQPGPLRGSEHHHLHDALAVDFLVVLEDTDVGDEGVGDIHERHRRAGVQAQWVLHGDVGLGRARVCTHVGLRSGDKRRTRLPVIGPHSWENG